MALLKEKSKDISPHPIIWSKNEALKNQLATLHRWKQPRDVFFIKYGGTLLASASAFAGISINRYYRSQFKLGPCGKRSSYLAICVIPALFSFLLHTELILPYVVLQNTCPFCLQMRSAAIQSTLGLTMPAILAPLSAKTFATKCGTYKVQHLTRDPLNTLKFWTRITLPISNILFAVFVGQALLGATMTNLESQSVKKVNKKLDSCKTDVERGTLFT